MSKQGKGRQTKNSARAGGKTPNKKMSPGISIERRFKKRAPTNSPLPQATVPQEGNVSVAGSATTSRATFGQFLPRELQGQSERTPTETRSKTKSPSEKTVTFAPTPTEPRVQTVPESTTTKSNPPSASKARPPSTTSKVSSASKAPPPSTNPKVSSAYKAPPPSTTSKASGFFARLRGSAKKKPTGNLKDPQDYDYSSEPQETQGTPPVSKTGVPVERGTKSTPEQPHGNGVNATGQGGSTANPSTPSNGPSPVNSGNGQQAPSQTAFTGDPNEGFNPDPQGPSQETSKGDRNEGFNPDPQGPSQEASQGNRNEGFNPDPQGPSQDTSQGDHNEGTNPDPQDPSQGVPQDTSGKGSNPDASQGGDDVDQGTTRDYTNLDEAYDKVHDHTPSRDPMSGYFVATDLGRNQRLHREIYTEIPPLLKPYPGPDYPETVINDFDPQHILYRLAYIWCDLAEVEYESYAHLPLGIWREVGLAHDNDLDKYEVEAAYQAGTSYLNGTRCPVLTVG